MIYAPSHDHIAQAAGLLRAGGIVGLPTETVYGLAADASQPSAVAQIYATKGRPSNHPLIVHLAPQAAVSFWARTVPAYAHGLIQAFWPGPLTLVLPRTAQAGDFITGQQATVALRCPAHPVAQALLQLCLEAGIQGLAAPSANRFGRVSPTTAQHVHDEFAGAVFTLDGGACAVGIESTIVDCTLTAPRILRHGAVSVADVARVTGLAVLDAIGNPAAPRVSGSLAAHYAPATPLRFCSPQAASALPASAVFMGFSAVEVSEVEVSAVGGAAQQRSGQIQPAAAAPAASATPAAFHTMPSDAAQYAQQLYATLRQLDAMGFSEIAVQALPQGPQWAGVADRLSRAAATFA